MDELLDVTPKEPTDDGAAPATLEEASAPFVGRWNRLVSQTNWEKGRIIFDWRETMVAASAAPGSFTDECWATRVGGVTPQHVGRLRRVWERFGQSHKQYIGLYWSHFQAALDWDDSEMWLEGASQNRWSISQMRSQRAEAIGATTELGPRDEDVIDTADEDDRAIEDFSPLEASGYDFDEPINEADGSDAEAPFGDEAAPRGQAAASLAEAPAPVRPFENLGELPPDLNEAFEAFKLAIISRRLSNWEDISCDDVLASLDALRQLAVAPN